MLVGIGKGKLTLQCKLEYANLKGILSGLWSQFLFFLVFLLLLLLFFWLFFFVVVVESVDFGVQKSHKKVEFFPVIS